MSNLFYSFILILAILPETVVSQIFNEKLFFDSEQKETGQIAFQLKVKDGVILGGRFLEKNGYVSEVLKLDTLGNVQWTTTFSDSLNIPCRISSPLMDIDDNLYVLSDITDEFNSKSSIYCSRINTSNGSKIWEQHIGIFHNRSTIVLRNHTVSNCIISVFPYNEIAKLITIDKSNGTNANFTLPVNVEHNFNVNSDGVTDNDKNIYLHSGTRLYKFDGSNNFRLLWSIDFPITYINKVYVDRGNNLYLSAIDNSSSKRLVLYKLNPSNGNTLYSSTMVNSIDGIITQIKEDDTALYFISQNRYVGGGDHHASVIKYNKNTSNVDWDKSFFINTRYSTINDLDFDGKVFVYLTGHESGNDTYTGDWTIFKINANDGSVVYKNTIKKDSSFQHIVSEGKGVYILGNQGYLAGHLHSTPNNYIRKMVFAPFNIQNGQILNFNSFAGNYQIASKVEQIITTPDRVIVVKQHGRRLNVESYNYDKRLIWTKNLEINNYRLQNPTAVVSPTGNIGIVAKGFTSLGADIVSTNMDSLRVFVLDKNGQFLWVNALPETNYLIKNNDIYFNDADKSIFVNRPINLDNQFLKITKSYYNAINNRFSFNGYYFNRLEINSSTNFLRYYLEPARWCTFDMTDFKESNCTQNVDEALQRGSIQASTPLHRDRMFFALNHCPSTINDTLIFTLMNTVTGKSYWQTRFNFDKSCVYQPLKLVSDNAERYLYALAKNVDSVFLFKFDITNGRIISNKFLFADNQDIEIQDFVVTPTDDRLIITGTISQQQYGGKYKNTFLRIIDATNSQLISYEIKKGDYEGDNSVGKGIAFFNDNTFWMGGNIQKNRERLAGILYEGKIANQLKTITGEVLLDLNNNGVIDTSDTPLSNAVVTASVSKSYAITDSLGFYTLYIDALNIKDTISANVDIKNVIYNPKNHVITPSDTVKNFLLTMPANTQDLRITLTEITPPRAGFINIYHLNYKNLGNKTISGKIRLTLNNAITVIDARPLNPLKDSISNYWNYINLKPNEEYSIRINCKTDLNAQFGINIQSVAFIEPIITDAFKADNIDTLAQTVVGSYDPNDKQVSFLNTRAIPSVIDPTTELTYTIRFQNTGNYPADFVKITDTLSDKLDLSTFRMIAASHDYTVAIRNKNALVFDFNPIYLPDSVRDEKGSHGFVKFAIKPKKTLTKDEVIKNTAFIYFDYNPAIITNTVETANQKINKIFTPSVSEGILKLSPNPAYDILTFDIENATFKEGNLSIYDISGRLVMAQKVFSQTEAINIGHLVSGEYVCIIKSKDNLVFSNKFIKMN